MTILSNVGSLSAISWPSATHDAEGSSVTIGMMYSCRDVGMTSATWKATDASVTGWMMSDP